ncbi:AAA family ATPase [Streptomyces sp. NPDC001732]
MTTPHNHLARRRERHDAAVAAVLVLGVAGAGKSTLAGELDRRGLTAVDSDEVLARWVDGEGRCVEYPAEPDSAWLAAHHWHWDGARLDALLRKAAGTLFVCGTALNVVSFIPRFDLVILLELDTETMVRRVASRSTTFGRTGVTREWLLSWAPGFQRGVKQLGARVVDARLPAKCVADTVIRLAEEQGLIDSGTHERLGGPWRHRSTVRLRPPALRQ